jgi:hypothetical protein
MAFQTPQYQLSDYLKWTASGRIQLPDFQRGYKWEHERIRSLIVSILRGHPLGVVMLLATGGDLIRFKPRPIEGPAVPPGTEPELLLLDGQQRLTSLTQALTGSGVVGTKDSRGKLLDRRYYLHLETALEGEDRIDDAVISVPGDGVVRSNFGKDIELDLSDEHKERAAGHFPLRLLYDPLNAATWLAKLSDQNVMARFLAEVLQPAAAYNIPAIQLDNTTSKAAVATVFEKVNTGGLPLNVFELLTASFAGDKAYFDEHATDFRLNDDWQETAQKFAAYPVLAAVENTDFLQAITTLATRKRNLADTSGKPPAISAKREDILKLSLDDYLEWVGPLREAFVWASTYLADLHIFDVRSVPYPKQLVPLAAIRVVLGPEADLYGVRERITQWFWCGVLGELYGSAIETRFVRDLEQVPDWATARSAVVPRTVQDASFVESRLHSLRTRNAAAYKGIYALILGQGARDWLFNQALDKVPYMALAVDVHHVFPQKWCIDNGIDSEHRESIVNKTPLAAKTNRIIGGIAPAKYLATIEKRAMVTPQALDEILRTHLLDPGVMRSTDFDAYFAHRREALVRQVEKATGKAVQRDVEAGNPEESVDQFDAADAAMIPDEDLDASDADDMETDEDIVV